MENNNESRVDYFEQVGFHPSLDFKNNILILGFRVSHERGKENNVFFIVSKGSYLKTTENYFEIDGKSYNIEIGTRKLTKLSERWSSSKLDNFWENFGKGIRNDVNPIEIFKQLNDSLKKYISLKSESDYSILTAWIIGTYFFPIFSAYPYLNIKAPKNSGKTQCLNFINNLAFNAIKARATLPALMDATDALRGTYLMDQADSLYGKNSGDLVDTLTDSYKKGSTSRKMVQTKNGWVPTEFEAYSPKAFVSISQLPEDLRDRCLIIPLIRSNKNFPSLDEDFESWKIMRGSLYKLLITEYFSASVYYETKKVEYQHNPEIAGRNLELWLPLEVIFEVVALPKEELKVVKERFMSMYDFAKYQASELETEVVKTILESFIDKEEITLSPKEIAERVNSSFFDEKTFSIKQQSAKVGKIITKFNLSVSKKRTSNGEQYTFKKEEVEEIYSGYFSVNTVDEPTPSYIEQKELEIISPF